MDAVEIRTKDIDLKPQTVSDLIGPNTLPETPLYQLRIHAIRTANDDWSQEAPITQGNIEALVAQANAVYFRAGIKFLFDPTTDLETKNNTLLNHDFKVVTDLTQYTSEDSPPPEDVKDAKPHIAAQTKEAEKHKGKIVVYFRVGDKLKFDKAKGHWTVGPRSHGNSSWAGHSVHMPGGMPEPNLLAHELGHYLHNRHPFVEGVKDVGDAAERIKRYVEEENHPVSEGVRCP
jgi:hypothetical protein